MKRLMALMALTILTACDYVARRDVRGERDDRLYRTAMDDYRAGRMNDAVEGFEKAVRGNPANASARFQLACLEQDVKKDFVSAYFGYREFLLQQPESDRARLARDRMAICEREMAKALSSRYGLNSAEGAARELAAARAENKALADRVAAAEKNLGASQERVRTLLAEKDRLLAVIKGEDTASDESKTMTLDSSVLSEKQILEKDDEDEAAGGSPDVLAEKRLLEEDERDEVSTGSSLIPVRKPESVAKHDAAPPAASAEKPKEPSRPKTYVVQEGDTLFGISKKFYGSIQPWKMIRDANKAVISSDNRLRAGDTIVLP